MKQIIILENSARVNMGGGQKMSLYVADILLETKEIIFADFTTKSRYWNLLCQKYKDSKKINLKGCNFSSRLKLLNWFLEFFFLIIYAPINIKKLYTEIDKDKAIVYVTTKKGLLYAYILFILYHIPYIYHAHLVENKKSITYPILKYFFNRAKKIICVSKSVSESIDHINKSIIFNPIISTYGIKKQKVDKRFTVASIGSLIEIKGFEYFIEAAQQIDKDIEFRIYGEGIMKSKLLSISNNRIHFMGYSTNILEELYHSIDIIVVPTIIEEALNLTILEAKSVGIPAIVTNIGGQAEIVEDGINGFHVPIKDSNKIKEKIEILTSDLSLYNKMSKEAFNSSSKFEYKTFKKEILNCFN